MTEALITPEVLRWARERLQFSVDTTAEMAHVRADKLALWEKGEGRPTFRQAQKLAQALHIPFGFLFLSSPPEEKPPLPDLRTIRGTQQPLSADFMDVLNDVLRKQQWYREYLLEEGAAPLAFIGRFGISDVPEQVAENIRQTIGVDDAFRREAPSWEDFLRKFIERVESTRILVLRSGIVGSNTRRKLSVQEFRGFVISDEIAPLVFLNSRDARAAQIFTLAHELAHLWIGESGISNPNLGEVSVDDNQTIERFCNQVAAELLVPRKDFRIQWQQHQAIEDNLNRLVRHYRVSSLVVLRRAFDLGRIRRAEYFDFYRRAMQLFKQRESRSEGEGGGFLQNANNAQQWAHNPGDCIECFRG